MKKSSGKSSGGKITDNKFLFPRGKTTICDWPYYLAILPLMPLYFLWWAIGSAFFEYEPENSKFQKTPIGIIILIWTIVIVIFLLIY